MTSVGDVFVIEIAEIFKGAESGHTKYRIKGFDNLVFDDKGISKLEKINPEKIKKAIRYNEADAYKRGYKRGRNEVLKC